MDKKKKMCKKIAKSLLMYVCNIWGETWFFYTKENNKKIIPCMFSYKTMNIFQKMFLNNFTYEGQDAYENSICMKNTVS